MALKQYVGPSLGDFGTDGNWSPSGVPGATDDAVINLSNNGALFVVFSEIAGQVVHSITIGPNDELEVINHRNLVLFDGTGSGSNQGILEFFQGTLVLAGDGGTFNNQGSIHLDGGTTQLENGNAVIDVEANTVLNGGGNVQMVIGGGPSSNLITGGNPTVTLTNLNNTISGDGTIGGTYNFINESHGTIETNNTTSTHGGNLAIVEESISGFAPGVFTNDGLIIANSGGTIHISVSGAPGFLSGNFTNAGTGTIAVDSGGTLIFGLDGKTETIQNEGSIELSAIPGDAVVQIAGSTTIRGTGLSDCLINLLAPSDQIVSDGNAATLTLDTETLQGTGTVGDANKLVLINDGSILANTSGQPLTLEALNAINNGVLEARGGGHLLINNPLDNTGLILVADTGSLISVVQPVTGSGAIDISDNGTLAVFGNGSIAGDVLFNGANATLSEVPGAIGGTVNGAVFTDAIIFQGVSPTGDNVVWDQTSPTAGTLSLFHDGTQVATLNMGGEFNSSNFGVSAAGPFATEVTVQLAVTPLFPFPNDPGSQVEMTYIAYFGRAGDPNGTNFWVNELIAGGDTVIPGLTGVAAAYSQQPEAMAQYPLLANPQGASQADIQVFINAIYQNLFDRSAEQKGLAFWTNEVNAILATGDPLQVANGIGQMAVSIALGAQGNDQTVLENKVTASDFLTQTFAQAGINTFPNPSTLFTFAHTDIAGVDASQASVTAAETATTAFAAAHATSSLIGVPQSSLTADGIHFH